jgi:thioesterase domain-containing protein
VYCLRGWLGVWSRGVDVLAQRVRSELGVQATSLSDPEWRKIVRHIRSEHGAGRWQGPLVLVGHSLGGDDQVRVAKVLHESAIPVELMILIDANTPPAIPPNVRRCVNIYKSQPLRDALPMFRGVRVRAVDPTRTQVKNIDLRTSDVGFQTAAISHFNITDVKSVQDMAFAEIAKVVPRKRRS